MMLGLAVGVIGWLLIERAHSDAERGVFVMGSLALAGGASAYLALSPLLAGLAAGMFWNWSPGRADAIVRQDLQKFQHPLVVLMLLAAGASLQFSLAALWLFAPFVVFRLAGKLAGGWIALALHAEPRAGRSRRLSDHAGPARHRVRAQHASASAAGGRPSRC